MFNPTRKYRPFLQLAREAGAPVERSLASVGLTEAQFLNTATRLPIASAVSLCDALAELCGAPDIGLRAAQHSQLQDLDVLGYLMKFSPTPLAALEQLANYPRLVGDTAEFALDVRNGVVAIRGRVRGRRMLPVMADYTLGTLHRLVASMTEGCAQLIEIELPRPQPSWACKHEQFFGRRPSYDAEWATLAYEESCLRAPSAESDPQLLAILQQRAEMVVQGLPSLGDELAPIRACLSNALDQQDFAIDTIARRLGWSERTLRRRLDAHGSSYRELLDEVRRERTLWLARDPSVSVATLATRAGFDDPSAFARAFRRWTGGSPSAWRERD